MKKFNIVYLPGDGIGKEMSSCMARLISRLPDRIELHQLATHEELELYASVYRDKHEVAVLKGPLASSWKTNHKNTNVQLKRKMGVFASIHPYRIAQEEIILIRDENSGIQSTLEHRQTEDVVQSLHFTSRINLERIIRLAFDFATLNNRKKVTCLTRSDMFKLSDSMMSQVFDEVASYYPEIATEEIHFDEGIGKLLQSPELFDVIVTPNSISDALIQLLDFLSGSHNKSFGINIGQHLFMADPVHGSAPDITGTNSYMPQAMLNGLYQLLTHIGALHSARTLQLALEQPNLEKLSGSAFFDELEKQIELLTGIMADSPPICLYYPMPVITKQGALRTPTLSIRELIGVDVFIKYTNAPIEIVAAEIQQLIPHGVELQLITSRGQQIWPGKHTLDGISDHIKCRFFKQNGAFFSQRVIIEILSKLNEHSVDILKTENLYLFNERAGFLMN